MAFFKRKRTKSGSMWTASTAGNLTRSTSSTKGRQRSTRSLSLKNGFTRSTTLRIGGWQMRRRKKGFFDPVGWLMAAGCNAVDSAITPTEETREEPIHQDEVLQPSPVVKFIKMFLWGLAIGFIFSLFFKL